MGKKQELLEGGQKDNPFDSVMEESEARAKIAVLLAQREDPYHMSEFTDRQVVAAASLMTQAAFIDDPSINIPATFVKWYGILSISKGRKGRREIVEVATSGRQDDSVAKKIGRRLLGING